MKWSNEGQSSIMWDKKVSCGKDPSNVGQCSLMWDTEVLYGREESYVEQNGLGGTEHSRNL